MSNGNKGVVAIVGAEKIAKSITSIATRGVKLARDIHVAAFSCIVHVAQHGDVTLANRLVAELKTIGIARSNAVLAWFEHFGPLTYDKTTKRMEFDRSKIKDDKEAAELLRRASITPPEKFKPEGEYKPHDFDKAFNALMEKTIKHLKEGGLNKGDKIDMELVAKLARVYKAHMGLVPEGSPGFAPEIELGVVKVEPTQKVPGKSEPNGKVVPPAPVSRSNRMSKAQQRAEAEAAIAA